MAAEPAPCAAVPPAMAEFPVVLAMPIQWGEQDSLGHVNHTVQLRWFETARFVYMKNVHLHTAKEKTGVAPILAAVKCTYKRQLKFPDTVHVGARTGRLGNTSLTLIHQVYSEAQGGVAAEGEAVIVVFDYASQKPVPVPADVRAAIEKLEGKPIPS